MSKITRAMQLFNYSPDLAGVCFGISMMAAQACLRQNNKVFADRIAFIQNCTEAEIETIKSSKKGDQAFAKKVDLLCFFDGISMYQGADSVNADFKSIAPQHQDMVETGKLLAAKAFKNDDQFVYPQVMTRLINAYTREELFDFIQTIKQYFGKRPFSIEIVHSSINHATLIGFDGNKWLSVNHDLAVLSEDNFNGLQKAVDNVFMQEQYYVTERMTAILNIIQPVNPSTHLAPLKPLAIPKPSAREMIVSFNKGTIFHLLACYVKTHQFTDYLHLLHELSCFPLTQREKIELVEANRGSNATAIHFAIYTGNKDIFYQILKAMDVLNLSFETKISIINKKHSLQGVTALYYAAHRGNKSIVKSLLDLAQAIDDPTLKADFLHAGKSALFAAAANGHLNVVRLLVKAILSLENKTTQHALLLAEVKGRSALFIAARNGHAKVVAKLVKVILSIEDQAVQIEGLTAKDSNGDSALLIAIKQGHKEVIKALSETTDRQGKQALSIAEQLGAKDITKPHRPERQKCEHSFTT